MTSPSSSRGYRPGGATTTSRGRSANLGGDENKGRGARTYVHLSEHRGRDGEPLDALVAPTRARTELSHRRSAETKFRRPWRSEL